MSYFKLGEYNTKWYNWPECICSPFSKGASLQGNNCSLLKKGLSPLSCWIHLDAMPTSNFQPIRLLDLDCCYKCSYLMANSADPDQLASSEANWSWSTPFAKEGYIRVQQDKGKRIKILFHQSSPHPTSLTRDFIQCTRETNNFLQKWSSLKKGRHKLTATSTFCLYPFS